MDIKEIQCIISGKVRGVGYRDFALRHARALWLVGFAKNLPDFTVRIVAQGTEENLRKFIEHLRKGPFLARVRDVTIEWHEPKEFFKEFAILF